MPRLQWAVLLASLALGACSGGGGSSDAGDGGSDITVTDASDARTDDAVADGGTGLRHCTQTSDCAGSTPAMTCDLTYPGGLCRVLNCTRDSQCGSSAFVCTGTDVGLGCVPNCAQSGDSCATSGGLCLLFAQSPDQAGCFPSCYETVPSGYPACVSGRMCDPYLGECATTVDTERAPNGGACTADADCRGYICILEVDDTATPAVNTGWLGGYCLSQARQATNAQWDAATALLRSNCPAGSVILPPDDTDEHGGEPTTCYAECRTDSDCRSGYLCDHYQITADGGTVPAFTNGACFPIDCLDGMHSCPSGFRCTPDPMTGTGPQTGTCGVTTGGSDGGTGDAATTDGASTDGASTDGASTDGGAMDAATSG